MPAPGERAALQSPVPEKSRARAAFARQEADAQSGGFSVVGHSSEARRLLTRLPVEVSHSLPVDDRSFGIHIGRVRVKNGLPVQARPIVHVKCETRIL